MQDKQIEFCLAIADGNKEAAIELHNTQHNKDFLTKSNDYGYNPAIFSLWATTQTHLQQPNIVLAKLYPEQISNLSILGKTPAKESIQQIVEELIFPYLKSALFLLPLLRDIGLRSASPTVNKENGYAFIFAYEAMGLILHDPAFFDIPATLRNLAQRIYDNGLKHAMLEAQNHVEQTQSQDTKEGLPETIKSLIIAGKNEKRPTVSSLEHFSQVTNLSSARDADVELDALLIRRPTFLSRNVVAGQEKSLFNRGAPHGEVKTPLVFKRH